MINLDEYMEDHLAAKAAAKEAEEKVQRAEEAWDNTWRMAQQDNERRDRVAVQNVTMTRIAHAARTLTQLEVTQDLENGWLIIGSVNVNRRIDFKEERTHTSKWRSNPTGKVRISVGDYGNRTSFPQRKDGTHNYLDIARQLVQYAEQQIEIARKQAVATSNRDDVEALRREIGVRDYCSVFSVTASSSRDLPVFVKVDVKLAMTADQARALAAAIKAAGIKLD